MSSLSVSMVTVSTGLVFSTLIENVHKKKAQMFSFAWGSDYPDAENTLALFYGPNSPFGPNYFHYQNPEFDELYLQLVPMEPSAERNGGLELEQPGSCRTSSGKRAACPWRLQGVVCCLWCPHQCRRPDRAVHRERDQSTRRRS